MVLVICSFIFGSKINSWIKSSLLESRSRSRGKGKLLEDFCVVFLLSSPSTGTKLSSSETRHSICILKLTDPGKLQKIPSYLHRSYSITPFQCCFLVSWLWQNLTPEPTPSSCCSWEFIKRRDQWERKYSHFSLSRSFFILCFFAHCKKVMLLPTEWQ